MSPPPSSTTLEQEEVRDLKRHLPAHSLSREDSMIARALRPPLTKDDSLLAQVLQEEEYGDTLTPPQQLHRRLSSERGPSKLLLPSTISRRPSVLESEEAREALRRRLDEYGLFEHSVVGDGACQFRALAHQMEGDQELHGKIRGDVVSQLEKARSTYENFVIDETYEEFLVKMASPSTWGDHVTLQAAADVFQVRVCLITSYPVKPFIHVLPNGVDDKDASTLRTLWLSFWAEVHYSSLEAFKDDERTVPLLRTGRD
mmetsp:Transcript_15686/g.51323  ORF Transcript_15686/g.51323 Transcript_15686/m.51323 type:complete len:258 (-) Transcript_15686:529-1302(-)